MRKMRYLLAKGVASNLVRLSFSRPSVLETPGFFNLMNRVFSKLAPSYDRLGMRLAPESVALGPLCAAAESLNEAPQRILDLACGTGLAALKMLTLFPNAQVVGTDISEKMIHEMMRKAEGINTQRLSGLVCNSSALAFAGGEFDLVMTQNAPPYPEEMKRVLRPGGTLLLAYSFVFVNLVQDVMERRLKQVNLEDVRFFQAEEGVAVTAIKPVEGER